MRRRRRREALKSINLLELSPVRLETWTEDDGRVLIVRTPPSRSTRKRIRGWFRFWMSSRSIRLDQIGSRLWLLLDGKLSVGEVADHLRSEFGDEVEPAEERTGEMIRRLHSEFLVAYPGWDDIPQGPEGQT